MFIQLYIVKVPIGSGSGENFPDPTKKVRLRNPGGHEADPDPQHCTQQDEKNSMRLACDQNEYDQL